MNRREFLELAGLGMLGAATPTVAEALQLDRIGLQLYTVRKLMEAGVPLTLEQVRKIGYREVEFAGYFGARPSQLRRWLDDLGLTAPAAHVPLEDNKLEQLMDDAAVVGHQYLVLASLPLTQRITLDGYRRAAALLNRAGEQARRRGLAVAYHNHDFEFKDRGGIVPYDVLLAETDPALVWFEVDFYWMAKAGRDPLRYFAAHSGRFRLCHLKDIDERGKITEVGRGRLDFQAVLHRRNQGGVAALLRGARSSSRAAGIDSPELPTCTEPTLTRDCADDPSSLVESWRPSGADPCCSRVRR